MNPEILQQLVSHGLGEILVGFGRQHEGAGAAYEVLRIVKTQLRPFVQDGKPVDGQAARYRPVPFPAWAEAGEPVARDV